MPRRDPLRPGVAAVIVMTLVTGCGDGSRSPTDTGSLVTIAAITPDTLRIGASVTISGSGFSATPGNNTVLIDGVAAAVRTATTAQLTVAVPDGVPCGAAHQATVAVRIAGGGSATAEQPIRPAISRSLAVGASLVITDPRQAVCNEFPAAGARYVMNVYSAATVPVQTPPFEVTGSTTAGPASVASADARTEATPSAPPTSVRVPASSSAPPPSRAVARTPAELTQDASAVARHDQMLARNIAFLQAHRGEFFSAAARRPLVARGVSTAVIAPPAVGSLRTLHIPLPSCASPTTIVARVAAVSRRAVIYEDTASAFAGQMDTVFAKLGDVFDTQIYPSDSANFADPLLTDPETDDDGRVGMVFSDAVRKAGYSGFTSSCDLVPQDGGANKASNRGEYFYGMLPPASLVNGPQVWNQEMQKIVAHEVKHLGSFEWRLLHHAPFEQQWLEEALAVHAEEVWARNFVYHVPWKGNAGYAAGLFCDLRLTDPQCGDQPQGMTDALALLYHFLDSTSVHSPFGRVSLNDATFYDSGWSLVRWAIDRYATDETSSLRALTQSRSLTGIANVAAVVGHSPEEIVGNWSLAMMLDDDPAVAGNANVNIATWNLYDIMSGIRADGLNSPPLQAFFQVPVAPVIQQVSGDFTFGSPGLWGGGFLPFLVTTPAATPTVALGLRGPTSGSPAPGDLRIAVARVR